MASHTPLKGIELVDCAKANAEQGIETAAELCGYGEDIDTFNQALRQACQDIGVDISGLGDLVTDQQTVIGEGGVEVAPDTPDLL